MAATPLSHEMSEKELEAELVRLARKLGWRRYHTHDSRRSPSGFPDEVLVRERVVWVELKAAGGEVSQAQKDWLRALHRAGCDAYVVRPDMLEPLAVVLAARTRNGDFLSGPDGERARVARQLLHDRTREETR